jgi:AcrR family transcriptional regulator
MATVSSRPSARPKSQSPEGDSHHAKLVETQRSRLIAVTVDAICEVGCASLTVAHVTRSARVSRRTFYRLFEDRDDCIAAAFERTIGEARTLAQETYAAESGWREGIRSALGTLLVAMDDRPGLARMCLVDVFGAGGQVMQLRAELVAELAQVIDGGRVLAGSREPPELTAEGVVGAILAVLNKRVLGQRKESLVDLLGPLMSLIVLPYLGAQAAGRELQRSSADYKRSRRAAGGIDSLRGLDIRVTYRTMRVLLAISEQPGASNRAIAHASGIVDQGQISKLMTRLERLALVENQPGRRGPGSTNAWYLTPRGIQLAGPHLLLAA